MSQMLRLSVAELHAMQMSKKPRVKNTKRKMVNGIEFDSTREARAWQDLCLQQQAGQITGLRRQVEFPIAINGKQVCSYWADFVFQRGGKQVVADAKGFRTEIYRLKRKLMLAAYNVEIEEL